MTDPLDRMLRERPCEAMVAAACFLALVFLAALAAVLHCGATP